jgi:hypothetical protein
MSEESNLDAGLESMRIGAMQHNLNQIVQFHNHVHGFFNTNLAGSQADENLSKKEKTLLTLEYESHLPNQLRKSVFLMMFGHLEEHLFLSWCDHGRIQEEKNDRADGIKKFKNLFVNLKVDLLTDQNYQLIVDAYKIRNAIIHTAGRIDFIKKPEELEGAVNKHNKYFEIRNKRVYVTCEGIFHFNRAVAEFTEKVTRAARRKQHGSG